MMHPDLRHFLRQCRGAVWAALLPVLLTAFVSIPANLHGYPGKPRDDAMTHRHMT